MKYLIFSFFIVVIYVFHILLQRPVKDGKVREAFCAGWCLDALFAVSGAVISFSLYEYDFFFLLRTDSLIWMIVYFVLTFLFIWIAPSGLRILAFQKIGYKKEQGINDQEHLLQAEYRFDTTLCMLRTFFFMLLFIIPIVVNLPLPDFITNILFTNWNVDDICGAFCFFVFLIMIPISLRQAVFWLKMLSKEPTEAENVLLKQYRFKMLYREQNHRI